jgi:hypothetical protein
LKDDLLAVYGNEATFGKINRWRYTLQQKNLTCCHALELAEGKTDQQLQYCSNFRIMPGAEEKIKAVTSIYNQLRRKAKFAKTRRCFSIQRHRKVVEKKSVSFEK